MKKEVEIFGFKFRFEDIFDKDGNMKVLGIFICVAYAFSLLKALSKHHEILKEILE